MGGGEAQDGMVEFVLSELPAQRLTPQTMWRIAGTWGEFRFQNPWPQYNGRVSDSDEDE